jgi:hypothetical protein
MNSIHYINNALSSELYSKLRANVLNLKWCRPPSGIPGNRTPRNVAVLGDGSDILSTCNGKSTSAIKSRPFGDTVAYPLFQSCKDCSAVYELNPFSSTFRDVIIHLRKLVRLKYGLAAQNIDKMFNIAICNFYTEKEHRINEHRDDERWLEKNFIKEDKLDSSIIASFTLYPDDQNPSYHRRFEIFNDDSNKWEDVELNDNSILFFSNHKHRCKSVPKRKNNVRRINITFRTITRGLLGYVGFSNFYRYMSIPRSIIFTEGKYNRERVQLFRDAVNDANKFNKRTIFSDNIDVLSSNKSKDKAQKQASTDYSQLPRYVKPLCSAYNIRGFNNVLKL